MKQLATIQLTIEVDDKTSDGQMLRASDLIDHRLEIGKLFGEAVPVIETELGSLMPALNPKVKIGV